MRTVYGDIAGSRSAYLHETEHQTLITTKVLESVLFRHNLRCPQVDQGKHSVKEVRIIKLVFAACVFQPFLLQRSC